MELVLQIVPLNCCTSLDTNWTMCCRFEHLLYEWIEVYAKSFFFPPAQICRGWIPFSFCIFFSVHAFLFYAFIFYCTICFVVWFQSGIFYTLAAFIDFMKMSFCYFIVIQEELLSSSCHLPLCLSSLLPLIRLGVSLSISLSSRSLWACCLFWLAASNLGKLAANPAWMLMNPGQCPPRSCRDVCFYKAQWLTS